MEKVVQITKAEAKPDPLLKIIRQDDWSAMRSAHSDREVFAYSCMSDSGNLYAIELFVSDLGAICGVCNCAAHAVCRHIKAALEDLLTREPTFGMENL